MGATEIWPTLADFQNIVDELDLTGGDMLNQLRYPNDFDTLMWTRWLGADPDTAVRAFESSRITAEDNVADENPSGFISELVDFYVADARETMDQDMTLDASELPDEMDLASSEYMQSFTFRLRGRERVFLQKIEKAIKKLDEGEFGVCEDCEEPISIKRLEARPETELCIRCKEDQERMERDFA